MARILLITQCFWKTIFVPNTKETLPNALISGVSDLPGVISRVRVVLKRTSVTDISTAPGEVFDMSVINSSLSLKGLFLPEILHKTDFLVEQ